MFHTHFQRFIPVSAFYPHFSVLSPIQRFILISVFNPHFSVLSPFQRCIPISVFYPHFSVVSPFQCFVPISAFYPHFSFRFQFPFQPFSVIPTRHIEYIGEKARTRRQHVIKNSKRRKIPKFYRPICMSTRCDKSYTILALAYVFE